MLLKTMKWVYGTQPKTEMVCGIFQPDNKPDNLSCHTLSSIGGFGQPAGFLLRPLGSIEQVKTDYLPPY
jgi:hypothetical protein